VSIPEALKRRKLEGKPAERILTLKLNIISKNERDGLHWSQRRKLRWEYEREIIFQVGISTPPDYKQHVTYTRVLGKGQRLFDESNLLAGSLCELQDCLGSCGYLHDDSPKWLAYPTCEQVTTRRDEGPLLIVTLRPAL